MSIGPRGTLVGLTRLLLGWLQTPSPLLLAIVAR